MSQIAIAVAVLEINPVGAEASEMIFLDDTSYEFVGGGDTYNGY